MPSSDSTPKPIKNRNWENSGTASCPVCGGRVRRPGKTYCSAKCYHNRRGNVSKHPMYGTYRMMMYRCYDPRCKHYRHYGGRGITVCEEWRSSPEAFVRWADSQQRGPNTTVDRKDNDGHYGPDNCHFVTQSEQNRNTRGNRLLEAFGEIKTVIEWTEDPRCVVGYPTLSGRLNRAGMNAQSAITTPVDTHARSCFKPGLTDQQAIEVFNRMCAGETGTALAAEFGVSSNIPYKLINGRIYKHLNLGKRSKAQRKVTQSPSCRI